MQVREELCLLAYLFPWRLGRLWPVVCAIRLIDSLEKYFASFLFRRLRVWGASEADVFNSCLLYFVVVV